MKKENIVLALLITVIITLYINKNAITINFIDIPIKLFFIIILLVLFRFDPIYGCIGLLLIIVFYKSIGIYDKLSYSKYKIFQYDKSIIKQPYKYTAVIVEPREHKAFEFVLKNFMENLDENWGFVIFHGTKNETYLKNIINNSLEKYKPQITLVNLGIPNMSVADYSMMFYEADFYSYIPSEMFLIFQTDSIILKENRDKIYDFMEYDYVGAPWKKSFGILGKMEVGNGGLSLRRKSKMIQLLKYKNRAINRGKYGKPRYGKYYAEDWFFNGYFCPEIGIKKPTVEKAKDFSIEAIYSSSPFGVHKPWSGLEDSQLTILMEKYPDINELYILNDYK
jgi:hypothetical protein